MSRPDMAVFEAYRRHYEKQMPPSDAKALALAEAQYEADEREAIVNENERSENGNAANGR